MSKPTILIVEDEIKLAQLLANYLTQSGYQAVIHHDGEKVIDYIKTNTPSLVLLDVMLPIKDGLEICKEVRQFSPVPIIMVTAKVEELDRLLGLELGADDYICKPFSPREVVARVKAVLRRFNLEVGTNQDSNHGFQIDDARYKVSYQGNDIPLTAVEFQLFKILISQPGHIYSRDQLMRKIYSDNRIVGDRTIDSHIKKLRKKVSTIVPKHDVIHAVYGVGYKFEMLEA